MEQKKIDRRIKYTKYRLHEAVLDLLEIYPVSKISVSMLCKKADINRTTFYVHYKNVPQMLEQIENDVMVDLKNYILSQKEAYKESNLEQILLQLLTYIAENQRLFRALLGKNSEWNYNEIMIRMLHTELIGIMPTALREDDALLDYVNEFSVNGSASVIVRWLETGLQESPVEMAKMITQMLLQSVSMQK